MSVKYKIDSEKIEILFKNNFSIADLLDTVQKALDQTSTPLPILVNSSNSTEIKSEEQLLEFVRFLSQNKEKIVPRIAIYAIQTVRYGTARQIGTYFEMDGIKSEAFYNRNDAINWLLEYKTK